MVYQGASRFELCPELQNPRLLTVTENADSKDEEGLPRPHLWLRSCWQWTATGERRVILLWCGHCRLPMAQWVSAHPHTCKQHQVDSGLEEKEEEEEEGVGRCRWEGRS